MSYSIGMPWGQTNYFQEATRTVSFPGEPQQYAVPRQTGNSPADVTSFHPGHRLWSIDNLPDIFYVLRPPQEWYQFMNSPKPAQKIDLQGNRVFEQYPEPGTTPRPILDYRVLPDKIGTREAWWVFTYYRRTDPRITWGDIVMRMELLNRPLPNTIQMRASRTWHPVFVMLSWHVKGVSAINNAQEAEVLSKLTPTQIAQNTTRGSTPGLVNPTLGEARGRVPLPVTRSGQRETRRRQGAGVQEGGAQGDDAQGSGTVPWETEEAEDFEGGIPEYEYPDPSDLDSRHSSPYFQTSRRGPTNIPGTSRPITPQPFIRDTTHGDQSPR